MTDDLKLPSNWIRPLEQVALICLRHNFKTISLTSPEPNPRARAITSALAQVFAEAGLRTLFVDFAKPAMPETHGWTPQADPHEVIFRSEEGAAFDSIIAEPTSGNLLAFNNVPQVKAVLDGLEYERVLAHLAPMRSGSLDAINPVAAGVAADAVFLICSPGLTTGPDLENAVNWLRSAGANVAGMILDETEINGATALIPRLQRRFPKLAKWMDRNWFHAVS